jgi:phosphoadenosine phosphosulfate reductase
MDRNSRQAKHACLASRRRDRDLSCGIFVVIEPQSSDFAKRLAAELQPLLLAERLHAARTFIGRGSILLTTSFGLEDQAITHAICAHAIDIEVVTLDTGRLFPETYDVWAETETRYSARIRCVKPERDRLRDRLEKFVSVHGINGFRTSLANRQHCCAIRKSEPLRRALAGARGWVTGLRAEQSHNRQDTSLVEFDKIHGLIKLNPLADWKAAEVARYIADNLVPYNVLHDRGFPSIGCAPCTRAVRVGEPERAGRWWWEEDQKKECGLHLRTVLPEMREHAPLVRMQEREVV